MSKLTSSYASATRNAAMALFLALASSSLSAHAFNVDMTQQDPRVVVVVGDDRLGGISSRQFKTAGSGDMTDQIDIPLPDGIDAFIDVAIDADDGDDVDSNGTKLPFVFALGVAGSQGRVCSFEILRPSSGIPGYPLNLTNCVGDGTAITPFSGLSAYGGTIIVSGGTGGLTVFEYNTETGVIDASPRYQNVRLPTVVGHPDVVLLSRDTAALSTDFNDGPPRFGTMIVGLSGDQPVVERSFRVENSLGFSLLVGVGNFPLVNCLYRPPTGDGGVATTIMYTANGALTVQNPFEASTTQVVDDNSDGLNAISCSVNHDLQLLFVISPDLLHVYSLREDPLQPLKLSSAPSDESAQPSSEAMMVAIPMSLDGRATSVVSSGLAVSYTNLAGDLNILEIDPKLIDAAIQSAGGSTDLSDGSNPIDFSMNGDGGDTASSTTPKLHSWVSIIIAAVGWMSYIPILNMTT